MRPAREPTVRPSVWTARYLAAAVTAGALAWGTPAEAQRLGAELRMGGSVGNYTETGAGLDAAPALSIAATVELRLTDAWAAYAGFTRSTFGCTEGFCAGRDVSLTSQGVVVGGRYTSSLPARPWLRAGAAWHALDLTADALDETSAPDVGWDLGLGIELPVGQRLRLRPGVTYLRHGAATGQGDGHVAVLAAELGVRVGLGG